MNKNKIINDNNISVGILGATGYTGRELVRILSNHPQVSLDYLGTSSAQGQKYYTFYPELYGSSVGEMTLADENNIPTVDILFAALPHGIMAMRTADLLARGIRVIDLGADFRLKDQEVYQQWYNPEGKMIPGSEPKLILPDRDVLSQAVYGLSEIYREKIAVARLIANPGCYPTASLLPLIPLLRCGLIEHDHIIIDAKSGVSGAGRAVSAQMHFSEVAGSFKAYGLAGHRHRPEIEQELSGAAEMPVSISFTPHLVPITRGMMATIYVRLSADNTEEDLRCCWQESYADEAFIHVMPQGVWPTSKHAFGSNNIFMQVALDQRNHTAVIVSVLDNLSKGASGQAVQNMNIMCGLPETQGLSQISLWP